MAGGETQTPVHGRPQFTKEQIIRIREMIADITEEKIRRMGGGVREQDRAYAKQEATREVIAWARENNIGYWPS